MFYGIVGARCFKFLGWGNTGESKVEEEFLFPITPYFIEYNSHRYNHTSPNVPNTGRKSKSEVIHRWLTVKKTMHVV